MYNAVISVLLILSYKTYCFLPKLLITNLHIVMWSYFLSQFPLFTISKVHLFLLSRAQPIVSRSQQVSPQCCLLCHLLICMRISTFYLLVHLVIAYVNEALNILVERQGNLNVKHKMILYTFFTYTSIFIQCKAAI